MVVFIMALILIIVVAYGIRELIDCLWFPLPGIGICAILSIRKSHRAKGGPTPPVFAEGSSSPPNERKEGDANVCYLSRFDSDRYLHCKFDKFVLRNL